MATNQKLKPCPHCGKADFLGVYKYDSGWCYVECDNSACTGNFYRSPGEGSVRQAIKTHNIKSAAAVNLHDRVGEK